MIKGRKLRKFVKKAKRAHLLSSKTKTWDIESIAQCLLNHPEVSNAEHKTITLLTIVGKIPKDKRVVRQRILAEVEDPVVTAAASNDSSDNVIYVKPDAIFGILLSLFIFFVTYVGVMCLFNTNTPKAFASKPFKYGREM